MSVRGSALVNCPLENRDYITFDSSFRSWCPYGQVQCCRDYDDEIGSENIKDSPASLLSSYYKCPCVPKDTCLEKIDYVTLRRSCPYGEVQCCIVKFQGSEPSTTTAATTTTTEGLDNDDLITL